MMWGKKRSRPAKKKVAAELSTESGLDTAYRRKK